MVPAERLREKSTYVNWGEPEQAPPHIGEFPVCLYFYICHTLCRKSFATLILCIVHHVKKMDEAFFAVATQEVDCLQVACDSLFCIFTVAVLSHGQTSSVSIQSLYSLCF